jgi:mRNA interferase MazF
MALIDPHQGEVWTVNFSPTTGAEITKVRPAVVLSLPGIGILPLRLIVPITDWKPNYEVRKWFVRLEPSQRNGLRKTSAADAFQTRSVSLERFGNKLGHILDIETDQLIDAINFCIKRGD